MTNHSSPVKELSLDNLADRIVSIIKDGRAQEAESKSIASVIINELLMLRALSIPAQCAPDIESARRTAQSYADFWGEQALKNEAQRDHFEVLASQFQRISNALSAVTSTEAPAQCAAGLNGVSMAIEACAKIAETNSELLSGEEIAFEIRVLALTSTERGLCDCGLPLKSCAECRQAFPRHDSKETAND